MSQVEVSNDILEIKSVAVAYRVAYRALYATATDFISKISLESTRLTVNLCVVNRVYNLDVVTVFRRGSGTNLHIENKSG